MGYHLAKTLCTTKHRIIMIEDNKELCMKIVNDLNPLGISVINGDGTDINFLIDADIERADALIAVTGRDQDNLIACQLAKQRFGIKKTIARVNNPKNINIFEQFGVDSAVSSTRHIADIIEREVDISGIRTLITVKNSKISINEIKIPSDFHAVDRQLKDLHLPENSILISVIREEKVIIPNGFTEIKPGDLVIAISKNGNMKELEDYLLSSK
ncbi:Trk system potassium uptake protein TrkA [Oxobacter pfennigii]|uniref:Trk system potassium uptake protein TrkA n=1 Tax=Oxobacter pfennigii TaxID=36849 RepID=A0A0P8W7N3_9CLOT|nr:Trk system potassium uptake protein TrkA [Oxobacter pfennigii]